MLKTGNIHIFDSLMILFSLFERKEGKRSKQTFSLIEGSAMDVFRTLSFSATFRRNKREGILCDSP